MNFVERVERFFKQYNTCLGINPKKRCVTTGPNRNNPYKGEIHLRWHPAEEQQSILVLVRKWGSVKASLFSFIEDGVVLLFLFDHFFTISDYLKEERSSKNKASEYYPKIIPFIQVLFIRDIGGKHYNYQKNDPAVLLKLPNSHLIAFFNFAIKLN